MSRSRVKAAIVLLVVIVIGVSWTTYVHLVRVEAWIWHMQHGTVVTVGNYIVSVPRNWYVERYGRTGQLLVRVDTDDPSSPKKLKAHSSLSLSGAPMLTNDQNLNIKMSLDRDLLERQGVKPILERTLPISGGTVSCAGGYKPGSIGTYDVEPSAWFCGSVGLEIGILGTDRDMTQIWEIISGIRKKS
jgi:hypothetical protein